MGYTLSYFANTRKCFGSESLTQVLTWVESESRNSGLGKVERRDSAEIRNLLKGLVGCFQK